MRIQHNIPAMSAYRNYTNNTSALAKNLEKLSSGYKINRAGDDAAGLAISEKMRAQISGLEQAQSNAKSGINLVQTAEGALTEVHDMLNRMVTLAEQSANGTYDNEVDRVQLQKEVEQLRSEINRIADSANFNGIKLLDGSMDEAVQASQTLKLGKLSTASKDMLLPSIDEMSTPVYDESGEREEVKTQFAIDLDQINLKWEDVKDVADDKTIRFKINFGRKTLGSDAANPKDICKTFNIDASKAKMAFDADGNLDATKLTKLLSDSLKASRPVNSDAQPNNYDEDGFTKDYLFLDVMGMSDGNGSTQSDYSGFEIKIDTNTNQMLFRLRNLDHAKEAELNVDWNTISSGLRFEAGVYDTTSKAWVGDVKSTKIEIDPDSKVNGWKEGMKDPTGVIGTNTITYNNVGETSKTNFFVNLENLKLDLDLSDIKDGDKILLKFDMGTSFIDADGNPKRSILGIQMTGTQLKAAYDTDADGNQVLNTDKLLDAIQTDLNTCKDANNNPGIVRVDVAGVCDQREPNGGYSGFDVKVEKDGDAGKGLRFELHDVNMAHPDEAKANWGDMAVSVWRAPRTANGTTPDAGNPPTDAPTSGAGYSVQLFGGDGKNQWSVGTTDMHDGVLPGQNTYANTVLDMKQTGFDVEDASKNDGYTITADGKTFVLAVGDDSAVAKADLGDTGAILVKVDKNATVDKQLQELANVMNETCKTWEVGATDKDSTAFYGLSFAQHVKGAKATDNAGHDLTTVEGIAKAFSFGKANVKSVTAGKSLTLQIGDTAESFNQMKVNIADMHAEAMGIGDIDISTQEGADAAMGKIKDAINYVSDIRGSLGATQNRLDHTINNLAVMQQNVQDAESTIRDVDIAAEMMEYTKNSILVQSAQAMLAQANQMPQGVLQLLQ